MDLGIVLRPILHVTQKGPLISHLQNQEMQSFIYFSCIPFSILGDVTSTVGQGFLYCFSKVIVRLLGCVDNCIKFGACQQLN